MNPVQKEREIQLHEINNSQVDRDALNIIRRLRRLNFRAYICGGGVRDLLLGRTPKDFDLTTDAHPRRLRQIFSNSRIIGRRFQLVHVWFPKQKIIEVATFRRQNEFAREHEACYIKSDNTFGTPREDARRRDFTVNGLFYDTEKEEVIDYIGGLEDLKRGVISSIGDPHVRFHEDPVRMVRAVKFASKLNMHIDNISLEAIDSCKHDLLKCSPSRLVEETMRFLREGYSERGIKMLNKLGLLKYLLPQFDKLLQENQGRKLEKLFYKRLDILDEFNNAHARASDALLVAILFAFFIDIMPRSQNGLDYTVPERILEIMNESPVSSALPRAVKGRVMEIVSSYRSFTNPHTNIDRLLNKHKKRKYFPESFAFWRIDELARGKADELDLQPWIMREISEEAKQKKRAKPNTTRHRRPRRR